MRLGADRAGYQNARVNLTAAQLAEQNAHLEAEQRNAEKLIDVITATQLLEVGEKFLTLKKSSLDLTKRLYDRGSRPAQDVEKLTLDVAGEEAKVRAFRLARSRAQTRLTEITGNDLTVEPTWPWVNVLQKWTPPAKDIPSPLSERVLTAQLEGADASIREARASLYPTIDIGAGYNWFQNAETDATTRKWDVALVLNLPLYSRGTDYFDYRQRLSTRNQIALELQQIQHKIKADANAAQQDMATAAEGIRTVEDVRTRAKILFEQSLRSFQKGLLSVNDLVSDQSRFLQAESDAITTWAEAHRAMARLCRVQGHSIMECIAR